mgnify:CR=1 FL=1
MTVKKTGIPPNGFAGFGQQSVATQQLVGSAMRKKPRRKKRATKKRPTKRRTTKRRVTRKKKPARLVKGSAAAKRHMAKLRAMRKS